MSEDRKKKLRADRQQYEQRLLAIQVWIIESVPSSLIIKQVMDKGWSLSHRHAQRMLTQARERWVEYESDNVKQKRQIKVQQLKQLIRSLQEKYKGTPEGIKAVVAVEKEIIRLEGIAAPIKLEHTGNDGEPIKVEHTSNVDYTKLPTEVLRQIVSARIKPGI